MFMLPLTRLHFAKAGFQTIHVPADFPTIQSAIDNANPGATILVASGTYVEHLIIDRNLLLIGEDRDTTIIDGNGADTVISIAVDDVTIESFTITKSGLQNYTTGIGVNQARGIFIDHVKVMNTYTGIDLSSSTSNDVANSIIVNNTNGLVCLYSNSNLFSNDTFSGNGQAISLYYCGTDTFVGNTLSDDVEGLFLSSSSNKNNFYHNNFEDEAPVTSGSSNIWNHGNEGNYWADYNFTGQDANGDGIGAQPYQIDDNNFDYYPLMGTYAEYNINLGNLTYYITNISNSTIFDLRFEIDGQTGNRILSFNATGTQSTTGFCRITIPTSLMGPPFMVTTSTGAVTASLLGPSNGTISYLYFSYPNDNMTLDVIYSSELQLYNELLNKYAKLQADSISLNSTYQTLLSKYDALFQNLTQLQSDLLSLNSALGQNLLNQSENAQNLRNLTYVFASLTAAFLITTVYLSSRLYLTKKQKT
jgi:parallel beta-helix repeat protein